MMNDLLSTKFFPAMGFFIIANSAPADVGIWGEVIKNGFLAVCLVSLAMHTAKERDKDRLDKKEEAEHDRAERAEERKLIEVVLNKKDEQIKDLTEKLFNIIPK